MLKKCILLSFFFFLNFSATPMSATGTPFFKGTVVDKDGQEKVIYLLGTQHETPIAALKSGVLSKIKEIAGQKGSILFREVGKAYLGSGESKVDLLTTEIGTSQTPRNHRRANSKKQLKRARSKSVHNLGHKQPQKRTAESFWLHKGKNFKAENSADCCFADTVFWSQHEEQKKHLVNEIQDWLSQLSTPLEEQASIIESLTPGGAYFFGHYNPKNRKNGMEKALKELFQEHQRDTFGLHSLEEALSIVAKHKDKKETDRLTSFLLKLTKEDLVKLLIQDSRRSTEDQLKKLIQDYRQLTLTSDPTIPNILERNRKWIGSILEARQGNADMVDILIAVGHRHLAPKSRYGLIPLLEKRNFKFQQFYQDSEDPEDEGYWLDYKSYN